MGMGVIVKLLLLVLSCNADHVLNLLLLPISALLPPYRGMMQWTQTEYNIYDCRQEEGPCKICTSMQ